MMSATVKLSSGHIMPLMGFGTSGITGYENVLKSLDIALATGYRLIDTAQRYENEAEIGQALSILMSKYGLKRQDLFITSKLKTANMSAEEVGPSIEKTLRDLRIDYMDLFLIHYPKPNWMEAQDSRNRDARRECWLELEKLYGKESEKKDELSGIRSFVEKGKLKAIGVSNYEIRHLDEMDQYAKIWPVVNQCEFHPHYCRHDFVDEIRRRGIHFQAFSSLGRNNPSLMSEPLLKELAEKYKCEISQILLAWPMSQGISVLPRSSNPDRIKKNFEAIKIELSREDVEKVWALHKDTYYTQCRPREIL